MISYCLFEKLLNFGFHILGFLMWGWIFLSPEYTDIHPFTPLFIRRGNTGALLKSFLRRFVRLHGMIFSGKAEVRSQEYSRQRLGFRMQRLKSNTRNDHFVRTQPRTWKTFLLSSKRPLRTSGRYFPTQLSVMRCFSRWWSSVFFR